MKHTSLQNAVNVGAHAAQLGFDFPDYKGPISKIREEIGELEEVLEAKDLDPDRIEDELGDVLFSVVNLARKLGVDPEVALDRTLKKFTKRFNYVEERIRAEKESDLTMMEKWWTEAKAFD